MSVNSKMTAIADEIRTLSGTTGTMGLDAMATNVGDANTEVSSQAGLLAQIQSALEGKAAGGGSGGGTSGGGSSGTVETCRVQLSYPANFNLIYNCVENGEVVCKSLYCSYAVTPDLLVALGHDLSSVVKGSFLICGKCITAAMTIKSNISGDAEICSPHTNLIQTAYTCGVVYKINGDCTITITQG